MRRNHTEYTIKHNVKLLSEGGQFHGAFTITDHIPAGDLNGPVMIWDSNGQVPHDDMVVAAMTMGLDIDRDECERIRDEQTVEAITQYRNRQKDFAARCRAGDPEALDQKAEEDYERRAAFGPGVVVVDALTGKRTRT